MDYTSAIISGTLFGLFIAISVGPTLFAVIRYSVSNSYKAGLAFILGVSISDILYVIIANLASNWLSFLETHQQIIGIVGSMFFIVAGLVGLFSKYKPKRPKKNRKMFVSKKTYFKMLVSGFLMNTLNPAATILWLGAALQIAKAEFNSTATAIFFGICLTIILSADVAKVFLAERIRNWLTVRKTFYLNKISAGVIVLFGVGLLIYQFV